MKLSLAFITLVTGLTVSASSFAQTSAPAAAPAGSTVLCKDDSYYSGANKKGACSHHGGVKDWHGKTSAPAAAMPAAAAPAMAAPAAPVAATTTSAKPTATMGTTGTMGTMATGGRPGDVWVNTKSHTYHCAGDKYYGKTTTGEYKTEGQAKAAGNHPDHGKACS